MVNTFPNFTQCLTHQLPEDQASPIGLVCPSCKQRLYVNPPRELQMSFWESQPTAYALNREPCFVFTLIWDDFRIRSLHPCDSHEDSRAILMRNTRTQAILEEPPEMDLFFDEETGD